jgi:hypothetical protein
MGITTAELAAGLLSESYEVRIFLGPVKTWQITLTTKSGKVVEIETRRGTPKTWRVFEDAVRFVLTQCRESKRIRVELEGLIFEQR